LLNDFASERLQRGQEGAQTGQGCPQTLYLQVVELVLYCPAGASSVATAPLASDLGCSRIESAPTLTVVYEGADRKWNAIAVKLHEDVARALSKLKVVIREAVVHL